jgi:NAD(P)-dependent dehydrogenase (short-subunit alcohol dehydrogenase family)
VLGEAGLGTAGRRFAGRGAIVTGGGSGIGLAIAHRLAREGARLVLAGRDRGRLESARRELEPWSDGVTIVPGSVADPVDVERLVERSATELPRLDVLVNCAGGGRSAPFLELPPELWDETFAVNVRGAYLLSRLVARAMADDRGGGSIVNIASMDAILPEPGYAAYSAAKAALVGLTKAMALELAGYGIRVNAVSPGWTLTPIVEAELAGRTLDEYRAEIAPRVPLGRMAEPSEIAAVVAFLASDEASYLTGANVVADGGRVVAG